MLDKFIRAEELAKKWRNFSYEKNGHRSVEYNDFVWCYFSADDDHTSVRFGKFPDQLSIGFYSVTNFGGLTLRMMQNFDDLLGKAQGLLEENIAEYANIDEDKKKLEKEARRKILEQELLELNK